MEERRGLYRILPGKPEGKKPFGRPRSRWENNIKVDLTEIGYKGLDWIELADSCQRDNDGFHIRRGIILTR
jgi:hypothetical protein